MGNVDDPNFDLVDPIVEVEETIVESDLSEEEEPEPELEPEPVDFEVEEPAPEPEEQRIVIKADAAKKTKALPVARRVVKVAKVVRKGEVLGTFMDDSLLDVEVDQMTRLVKGKKRADNVTARRKSYGQSMFPNLPQFKVENETGESKADNEDDDKGYEDVVLSTSKQDKKKKVNKAFAMLLGHELLENEVATGGPLWLHGQLEREESANLLKTTAAEHPDVADGLFLVRPSSKGGVSYSVDVFYQGEIHHYLFKQRDGAFVHKTVVFEAPTLEALVEHLRNPDAETGLATTLRQYVSRLGGTNNYFSTIC